MTKSRPSVVNPIRVLLVDDHMLYREIVRMILSGADDVVIVGEAANGIEAVKKAATLLPDVVVMDVRMPVMDGITATRAITARCPQTVVVGLSAQGGEFREAMTAAGALMVLTKEDVLDKLYPALHRAMVEKASMADTTGLGVECASGFPLLPIPD
jgi:NarL family two-component system response regulator LiaR